MKSILTGLILLLSFTIYGQNTMKGQLFSSISKKPLSYTYIYLHQNKMRIQTDSGGFFSFPLKRKKLRVTSRSCSDYLDMDTTIYFKKGQASINLFSSCVFPEFTGEKAPSKMILHCCIGEVISPITNEDTLFLKEFGISYYAHGCTPMLPREDIIYNNRYVASYLDKRFGPTWRERVKHDVPGVTH